MKRREFLTLIAGASAWPIGARAQNTSSPVIGFLHVASAGPLEGIVTAFRAGLRDAGYTEGKNVAIEFRWAEGDYNRLPVLASYHDYLVPIC
jgi:putative ABC transport system substrate-binding protein